MKRWMAWIGGFVLLLALAAGAYLFSIYQTSEEILDASYEEIPRSEAESRQEVENVEPSQQEQSRKVTEENFSVLFIGIDDNEHRDQEVSRADALVLTTYNEEEHSVQLVHIPRDAYVEVPAAGRQTKIAHAHSFGGLLGTIEAVEQLFDIPVDYYARFNLHTFVDLVDAIGGVHFDVPYEITESNSYDKRDTIHLQPGYQLLDGEEALAVVRTRSKDSDIQRGQRQLEMMQAIADEAFSLTTLFNLENILQAIVPHVKTNFSPAKIRGIALRHFGRLPELHFHQLDGTTGHERGMAVYHIEPEHQYKLNTKLKQHLGIRSSLED